MLKENKRKLYITLVVVLVISVSAFIYLNLGYVPACQNYECWQGYMTECKKASFVSEQSEASWGYETMGKTGNECTVEVTLLLAKKGELGIDKLVGEKMSCTYSEGTATYPEKDLSACHGILREELQGLIIGKLHSYILENLGQVAEGLEQGI